MSFLDLDDRRTWLTPLKHVPDIVLIHLSDIHFRSSQQGVPDRNKDLRNEIRIDLSRQMTHLHRYDCILVTGDIAFAGRQDEFETARKWIESLCEDLKVDIGSVLVTPGNHDVDRNVAGRDEILDIRSKIRAKQGEELQEILTRHIAEPNDRLFESIEVFSLMIREFERREQFESRQNSSRRSE